MRDNSHRSTNVFLRISRFFIAALAVVLICGLWALPVKAEESGVEDFVNRLYNICLDREPDADGFNAWVQGLKEGRITGAEAAYGFIFSKEFIGKNPCNNDYIACLYRCFLGREPDESGRQDWIECLQEGQTRGGIFNGFVGSQEFNDICNRCGIVCGTGDWSDALFLITGDCSIYRAENKMVTDFVTRLYTICLNRTSDQAGLNSWIQTLENGQSGTEVAHGFIFSNEFHDVMYRGWNTPKNITS